MKKYLLLAFCITACAFSTLCFAESNSMTDMQACKDCSLACKDCSLACKDCVACKDCSLACKDCSLACCRDKLIAPLFLAAISSFGSQDEKPKYSEIDTTRLAELMKSGKKVIILDARDPKYLDGKMIPGAVLLSDEATPEQVKTVIPTKESLVVTYCVGRQCPASQWLADYLAGLGYTNVFRYTDGIQGWTNAGNKTEKPR